MKRISMEEFENKFVSVDGDVYDLGMLEVSNRQELLRREIEKVNGVEYLTIEVRMYETFEKDGYQAVRWQDVTINELLANLISEDERIILGSLELIDLYQHSSYDYNNWKTLYTCSYTIDSQDNETSEYKSGDVFMFEEKQALEMFKKRIGIYDLKKETPFVWCETLKYDIDEDEYISCDDSYSAFVVEMFEVDDYDERLKRYIDDGCSFSEIEMLEFDKHEEIFTFIKNSKNEFVCEV